jgi:Ricin-type beta-trefoil lectin domain-like
MNKRVLVALVAFSGVAVLWNAGKAREEKREITNQPIPNGLYFVRGAQSNRLWDIKLDGPDRGRLTIHGLASNNSVNGANQKFTLEFDQSTDAYKIITFSGECLDAAGDTPANNRLIHHFQCKSNNVSNQRFRLRNVSGDFFQVMVVQGTERCVDVINCSVGDRSHVNEMECKRPPTDPNTNNCSLRIDNQLWKFEPANPTPPPSPTQPPTPTDPPAASQLSDASTCGPVVSGRKSCKLKIKNSSDRDVFGFVCWINAIPPPPFRETCLPLEKTDITFPKKHTLDVPGASGVFPATESPAAGFRATVHF